MALLTAPDEVAETPKVAPPRRWTKQGLVAAAVAFGTLPLLPIHFKHLWMQPHYQFFPFLLAGFAYLVWQRGLRTGGSSSVARARLEGFLLLLATLMLIGATGLFSPWMAAFGAIFVAGALLLRYGGARPGSNLLATWALLWLLVPLPFGLDLKMVQGLQTLTSRWSSMALEVFGINHLMAGNVLELPGKQFMVEEACSGVHSLFALLACTAMFVVWARRPALEGLLLLFSVFFWASFMNTLRVVLIAVFAVQADLDLSKGWPHEVLGLVLFAVSVGMIISTDRLIAFMVSPIHGRGGTARRGFVGRTWDRLRMRGGRSAAEHVAEPLAEPVLSRAGAGLLASWTMAALFVALGATQLVALGLPEPESHVTVLDVAFEETSLPEESNGWKRAAFRTEHRAESSNYGEFSKVWTYASPSCAAIMSFDYPFTGWHDLLVCYRGQGWEIMSQKEHVPKASESADEAPYVEVEMRKPTGEQGYLVFSLFDVAGRPLRAPDASFVAGLVTKIRTSVSNYGQDPTSYQIQLFAPTDTALTDEQRADALSQYLELREVLRRNWSAKPETSDG